MRRENPNSQLSSDQNNKSKSEEGGNEEIIEEAAERLAELFYEQCLSERSLKRKSTGSLKRYRNNFT